jgi:hypothetical protein
MPYDQWNYYPQTGGYNSNWRFNSPSGSLYQSTTVFYRGNTLPWANQYRPFR